MIICTGSLGLDTTRTPFRTVERVLGGSASYFGVSASFFDKVGVVSAVGGDFPREYWRLLESKGVDLSGVQRVENAKTLFFDSSFDYDLYHRKVNTLELNVAASFNPVVPASFRKADVLFLATNMPKTQLRLLEQVDARLALMDTIEYYIESDLKNLLDVVKRVNGIIVNDVEARMLSGTPNLIKAGKKISEMGPEIVLIKKGEHGSILFHEREAYPFPGYPIEDAVDPTGAGDSFAGGFVGHLARRLSEGGRVSERVLKEAVVYGNVLGSFAVEGFSLEKLASITLDDVETRFNHYAKLLSFRD